MKKHLLFVTALFVCLAIVFAGCMTVTPDVTIPTEPSNATESTEPPVTDPPATEPPADPVAIYEAAIEKLGTEGVQMQVEMSKTVTLAGQTFQADQEQTIEFWNLGAENFIARVNDETDIAKQSFAVEEIYGGGTVYHTFDGRQFLDEMEQEDFLSRYPQIKLLDASLYTLALEQDDTVIRFADATGMEAWLAGDEGEVITAEALVTLDKDGAIQTCEYTAEYNYGAAEIKVSCLVTYGKPGDAPALPADTAAYTAVEDVDGIWMSALAYGYILQAEQYTTSILSTIQSQAAGLVVNRQMGIDSYVTDTGTDFRFETSTFAMDSTGDFEQEMTEKFIDGKYTASIDGGDETADSTIKAPLVEAAAESFLVSTLLTETKHIQDATITDVGSLLLVEYTFSEEMGKSMQKSFGAEYLGDGGLMDRLASSYVTNKMEYYLALDKYTLLPTATGYLYEGCHTIEGDEYILVMQTDQSFDLASLTSYETIYEETAPDTEPEEKPTPLFYHVTGPDGQEMWLFGTIHVGDDRTAYLPQEIYDALLSSKALAVECDTKGFEERLEDDDELQDQVSACYYYSDGSIEEHLDTEELYEDARRVLKATGNYFFNSEYQKASVWSSGIDNYYLSQGHQLVSEKGIESRLEKIAEDNEIPLWEVESTLFQIQMLNGYSDYLQEFQLYSSVYSHGKSNWEGTEELFELWCAGEEEALIEEMAREVWSIKAEDLDEELAKEDLDEEERQEIEKIRENLDTINAELEKIYNEYIKAMEIDRNAGMLKVAQKYLESGDTVFYAVGLAHLIAEDGLVNTLRDAGYTVERVVFEHN